MCRVKMALTIKKQYRTGVPVKGLAAACYMPFPAVFAAQ